MDASTRSILEFAGLTLSLIAGGLHLAWGGPRLVIYLQVGRLPDPRPAVFVLSAIGVAAAVLAMYYGAPERPVYGFLIGVMVVYLVGYVAWHLGGHPIFGPGGVQSNYHPVSPVEVIVDHLRNDLFALGSTVIEIGAIAALAVLLIWDA